MQRETAKASDFNPLPTRQRLSHMIYDELYSELYIFGAELVLARSH